MRWQKHLGLLAEFINYHDIRKIAEIGVEKGGMTRCILKLCPQIEEYWAIDQWRVTNKSINGFRAVERDEEDWFELYQRVTKSMIKWKSLRVLRMTSLEAIKIFHDKYFDFVYIDAEHSYEAVTNDIIMWYPKVRVGGYLGGHDFNQIPVKEAVRDYFGNISKDDQFGLQKRYVWLKQR